MRGDALYRIPKSPFWYYKLKQNGRWRGVSTKTTSYKDAKRLRRNALQDQEEGRLPEGEIARWPFERAAAQYLQKSEMRLCQRSLEKEAFFLVRPKKQFGPVPCERISAMHIQQLQGAMRDDGCKNTYNNLVLGATLRVLKYAKVWRRIRDDVTRLPEGKLEPIARVLESNEKRSLFEIAKGNPNWTVTYAAALIAANTTARGADLRGLRWSDVDLFEGVMRIPDSKTEAGKRRVPLNSDAIHGFRLLVDRATRLEIVRPECYVFPSCENSHIDATRPQKSWRTAWRNLTRAAGLKGLRFHDLRHQCITELLEGGAPEAAVLSIAGHLSRKMLEHYSHARMVARRKALEGLTPVLAVESADGTAEPRVHSVVC
jgi:integrase